MNCLVRGNSFVSFENLRRSTGLNFSNNAYLNLVTAANFAKTKYANKQESNGTCLPLLLFLQRIKKGSKKFRIRLCDEKNGDGIEKMQVVTTFFRLIDNPVPAANELSILYGSWNFSFFENRLRSFCFKFYNNSLGVGARIAARYRTVGQMVNDRCTFCLKAGAAIPAREDFIHVFYDCPYIQNTVRTITDELFPESNDVNTRRRMYMAGIVTNVPVVDSFLYKLTSIILNFNQWEFKIKKKIPSIATVRLEFFYMFNNVLSNNGNLRELATHSNISPCRRWRAGEHGFG
jgi:hypothetical protein